MKNQTDKNDSSYLKKIYFNEKLSKYSWFNLGGDAEVFFRPDNLNQLEQFFKKNKKPINIIGAGSNTLIRDGGIEGVTIKLSSKFSFLKLLENNIIEAGATTFDKSLSDYASINSIAGMEFLSCIPGSIGGGIRMNCGCFDSDISNILVSLVVMDFEGNQREINRNKINFFYRGCDLPNNLIILSAKFKGVMGKKDEIIDKQLKLIQKKKLAQPKSIKTCGSTFKNPENNKAWKLIKQSNSDKIKVGRIRMSDHHCNFLVNEGNGTSYDAEELIKQVKNKVLENTGVTLELEIKIIGKN